MNVQLTSVQAGTLVQGQYKRGSRPKSPMAIEVDRVFEVPTGFGDNVTPYLLGALASGPRQGTVTAVRADCFDPRTLVVEQISDYKPLPLDEGAEWYVTQGSGAFGFTERVEAEDAEWAVSQGGAPLADFEKESVSVPVLAE